MALSKTVKTIYGIDVINAYIRVEEITIYNKSLIKFDVNSYVSKDEGVKFSSKKFSFPYDIAGENPIKQAYDHLKMLPEFAGATDV